MAGLTCDIVTPQAKLYSGEGTMVVVPGTEGEMGFLQGHVPLVSALADGKVRVLNEAEETAFACMGGYVETDGNKVIVLCDRAKLVAEIDAAAVKAALAESEAKIAGLDEQDPVCLLLHDEIAWAKTQLAAVGTLE